MSENVIETPEEFGIRLEGYFARKYTPVQQHELKRWAERRSPRMRYRVYRMVVERERFLPLVATLNRYCADIAEGYPELDRTRAPEGVAQLTDDAGFTDDEMELALAELRSVVEPLARAKRFE